MEAGQALTSERGPFKEGLMGVQGLGLGDLGIRDTEGRNPESQTLKSSPET